MEINKNWENANILLDEFFDNANPTAPPHGPEERCEIVRPSKIYSFVSPHSVPLNPALENFVVSTKTRGEIVIPGHYLLTTSTEEGAPSALDSYAIYRITDGFHACIAMFPVAEVIGISPMPNSSAA